MRRPNRPLATLGLTALALANLAYGVLGHRGLVSPALADGLYGFGMGVAIAVLLLSFRRGEGCAVAG